MILRSYFLALGCLGFAGHWSAVGAQSVRIEGPGAGLTISQAVAAEARAQTIRVDGAQATAAIVKVAAENLQKDRKTALSLVSGVSGSAGGLGKLCGGEIDVAGALRPILKEEISSCGKARIEFIELPIAIDSVTVVVNARNSFVENLTVSQLRAMWEEGARGKIVRWSQIDKRFPDAPLRLMGPDARYESASVFTEAILGSGRRSRSDYMPSVDDRVLVQGILRDVNALTYVPYGTYAEHRNNLRMVRVVADSGVGGLSTKFPAKGADALLTRPVFLYVNVKSLEKQGLREFVEFTFLKAAALASATRYQPLTARAYQLALAHLRNRRTGTAWDGTVPAGITPAAVERRLAAL